LVAPLQDAKWKRVNLYVPDILVDQEQPERPGAQDLADQDRLALQEIVERGDPIFADSSTYLIAPVSACYLDALSVFEVEVEDGVVQIAMVDRDTTAFLETFEAENEDAEENGDMEPSIGTQGDLEDDSHNDLEFDGYVVAPNYSDDPEQPQLPQYPGVKASPVVVNPAAGEKGRIVPVG
jgi:hypothetical protein